MTLEYRVFGDVIGDYLVCNDNPEHYGYAFYCPACKYMHWLDNRWKFNGNEASPSFDPSLMLKLTETKNQRIPEICHLFVKDGTIQYLADCTHDLAGQTVPMCKLERISEEKVAIHN